VKDPVADICLVVEGTYPFVMGGVSTWLHGLVGALPERTFSVLCVVADEAAKARRFAYELPRNIVQVEVVSLRRTARAASRPQRNLDPEWRSAVPALVRGPLSEASTEAICEAFRAGFGEGQARAPISADAFLADPSVWEQCVQAYTAEASSESFAGHVWTWKGAVEPLLALAAAPLPKARLYHTISTGYAGWLAARAAVEQRAPLLVTEHGIYTKERRIELGRATWLADRIDARECPDITAPHFRRWWIRHFMALSATLYQHAAEILTIHGGNTALQLRDGAPARKLRVIPNGVDVDRIERRVAEARSGAAPRAGFTVGFIGRVSPIKDVPTLIDAAALAAERVPGLRVRIMGPMDEDPSYSKRCLEHAARVAPGVVSFDGPVDIAAGLAACDAVVLTSISEAQPLVILEAFAAGLPVVATRVGAVPELLFGAPGDDADLGAAGIVTPIGSPVATAAAFEALDASPQRCAALGEVGRHRVRRFYRGSEMIRAYRETYAAHLEQGVAAW